MTDHCASDFLAITDDMLGPSPMHIFSMCHKYMTDFAYGGPIFLVPLSSSYASSPVVIGFSPHIHYFIHLRQKVPGPRKSRRVQKTEVIPTGISIILYIVYKSLRKYLREKVYYSKWQDDSQKPGRAIAYDYHGGN